MIVLSRTDSFNRQLASVLPGEERFTVLDSLPPSWPVSGPGERIIIVHARSYPRDVATTLRECTALEGAIVAVAADVPELREMLSVVEFGVRAYFNTYMADVHYRHMLRLLRAGESWFAPQLLAPALEIARVAMAGGRREGMLDQLTRRERDIALDVAQGFRNREIAQRRGITERTVKTHLTHIFKKLDVADRLSLALALNREPEKTSA